MAPKRFTPPPGASFYRGDQWVGRFFFSEDVSDRDFVLQFKHSRLGPVIVTATPDTDHAGGSAPFYVDFTVPGETTDVLRDNLLTGDLQVAADDTWLTFTLPIKGEYAGGGSGTSEDIDLTVNVTLGDDVDLVVNVEVGGAQGPVGPQGERGPTGPAGDNGDFTFTQDDPATTWIIDHGLGRNPSVIVVVDGEQIDCAVTYVDDDHLELDFTVAVSGTASGN